MSAPTAAVHPPLVSIIITNYNYGHFLAAAITSALAQSYPHCEVIVVDDGSTDNSAEVMRQFAGRVQMILRPNGGQAAAMNSGFAHARGSLMIFLDADDLLLPHAATYLVEAWACAGEAGRLHARMEVLTVTGSPTGVLKPHAHLPLPQGDLRRHVLSFPDDMPWLPTSANAYPAKVLRRIMPIPERQFRILADVYLSHVTPLFGPVIALEEVCSGYRVHDTNNYETAQLDVEQIRTTVVHWRDAHEAICRFAEQLQLSGRPKHPAMITSVAGIANRLISLRLAPARHPLSGDSRPQLLALGVRAALGRFDVAWPMRLMFIAWFALMAALPLALARPLAELWLFPERRQHLNRWLARMHRANQHAASSTRSTRARTIG